MSDTTGSLMGMGVLGIMVAVIGLGFYQTYAMLTVAKNNPEAATRLATGVGVGMAARGVGEGFGAASDDQGGTGRRRRTGRKRRSGKTRRRTK